MFWSQAKSQPPWVGAASRQWGTQPGHMGACGGGRPRDPTGCWLPDRSPLTSGAAYGWRCGWPIPTGGLWWVVGGVLRRQGLGPAAEGAGFSLAQQSPALRWTARAWSRGSTAGTPSAPAANITAARRARRCGPMVSPRQLRPEPVGGSDQGPARAQGSGCTVSPTRVWKEVPVCGGYVRGLWAGRLRQLRGKAQVGAAVCCLSPGPRGGSWHPRGCSEPFLLLARLPAQFQGIPRGWLGESWASPGAV